jgi:hypothetical protein
VIQAASTRSERLLPNLLVPIDLRDGAPTEPSLFALSEARRVSHDAGLTVFAVVLADPHPDEQVLALAARLGLAGADKVLLCEGAGFDAPPLDFTHGPALQTAVERVPPLIVLFPTGGAGAQLGPALAARLGGAFASAADLEVSESPLPLLDGIGRVCLRRWRRDRSAYRRLDPVELERPVIAVLGAHGPARVAGTPHVEVQMIACAAPTRVVELESRVDEHAALPLAPTLIVVGADVSGPAATKLAAAAPAGVAVAEIARVAPSALAACAPQTLLGVQASVSVLAPSPRTKIGVAVSATADAAALGRTDVLWRGGADDDAWSELAAALPGLASPRGGAA